MTQPFNQINFDRVFKRLLGASVNNFEEDYEQNNNNALSRINQMIQKNSSKLNQTEKSEFIRR
jgi:hypothetical protein